MGVCPALWIQGKGTDPTSQTPKLSWCCWFLWLVLSSGMSDLLPPGLLISSGLVTVSMPLVLNYLTVRKQWVHAVANRSTIVFTLFSNRYIAKSSAMLIFCGENVTLCRFWNLQWIHLNSLFMHNPHQPTDFIIAIIVTLMFLSNFSLLSFKIQFRMSVDASLPLIESDN